MIGFAPTYAAVGLAAPLIIVLARLLQGLATGGEFASATSFLIESAPANRRGFYGSCQMVGQGLAVLIGALLGALITRNLALGFSNPAKGPREWLPLPFGEGKRKSPDRDRDFKVFSSRGRIQNCARIAKASFNTRVLCYQRRVCPDLLHKGHTG
jgi:hypothetical protein